MIIQILFVVAYAMIPCQSFCLFYAMFSHVYSIDCAMVTPILLPSSSTIKDMCSVASLVSRRGGLLPEVTMIPRVRFFFYSSGKDAIYNCSIYGPVVRNGTCSICWRLYDRLKVEQLILADYIWS